MRRRRAKAPPDVTSRAQGTGFIDKFSDGAAGYRVSLADGSADPVLAAQSMRRFDLDLLYAEA